MQRSVLTEPADTQGLRHAPLTIALHWITAALVMALWCIGQTVDWVPDGPWQVDYRSVHMLLGVTVGLVLIVRLAWRATKGGMLPPLHAGLLLIAARVTHWGLYVLLFLAVGLGITNALAYGDSVFNLFRLPELFPGDQAFQHRISGWHALAANTVIIIAGLHAVAALFHHYVMKDPTLRRMLPWA